MKKINFNKKLRKKLRISGNIIGTDTKPRISVFRSNKFIYAQAIDDNKRITIVSFSSQILAKSKDYKKAKKLNDALVVGTKLGELLKEKKIITAVFDRGIYIYKGRVAKIAEGLRNSGIKI